jgi:phosphoglycerate dehydrogenase-like enzyme
MTGTVVLMNALARPLVEGRLPAWVEPRWFASREDLLAAAPEAEIAWLDAIGFDAVNDALPLAARLRWLNTVAAGVERFPLDLLRARGVALTNGAGLNSITIAEYAVMGMLTVAKGYRDVVRAQDRHEWLHDAPGKAELYGSRALILGAGGIGGRLAGLLAPFGVDVAMMRRTPSPGMLGPDDWRARLGAFDWVVVAVASTPETAGMIGAAELAAMKPGACLLNFARGYVVDTDALVAALRAGRLGAAFLDVTDPEPLPPKHPLWGFANVHVSMHLSGRSQTRLFPRAAERFLENLDRYRRGEPLAHAVDLSLGY